MSIELNQIATNRYAPEGSQAINLYSTATADDLTLGQLVAAVCIRSADAVQAQSVNKMNLMSVGTERLEKTSAYVKAIAENTLADWAGAKAYLEGTIGVTGLPDNLSSYKKRIQAVNAVKEKLEVLTQKAQEDMIDMQTLMNRNDMILNTSSNIVRAMGGTKMNAANKF